MRSIFLLFLFSHLFINCQNEDKIWYISHTRGLDFRACTLKVLTNGVFAAQPYEGMVTVCDPITGRLLFYSGSTNIIDSTFNIMPGSVGIANNTLNQTQVIKKPGSSSIYYFFATEVQGGVFNMGGGLDYSTIDMSQNSGKGAVVGNKVRLSDTANCEKLTSIQHANGIDVWLVSHRYLSNEFRVFSVTSAGVNTTAIVSSVGPSIGTSTDNARVDAIGELRASINGQKLAFTCFATGNTCLFDFNNSTGVISNSIPLSFPANTLGGYGVSFSPNNKVLYVAANKILQFDISSGNATTIQASRTLINCCTYFRGLKLGPDGRIYVSQLNTSFLSVIASPDSLGLACNYVANAVNLSGGQPCWSLNNIMEKPPTQLIPAISATASKSTICQGEQAQILVSGNAQSYSWSPVAATGTNVLVTPNSNTIYTITATSTSSCTANTTIGINVQNCVGEEGGFNSGPFLNVWNDQPGYLNFKCSGHDAMVDVFDITGSIVSQVHLSQSNQRHAEIVLTAGIYYIRCRSQFEQRPLKVLVN